MKIYPQPEPFTLKLEPTEGCTLACWFCGIQSIRDNGADRDKQIHGAKSSPFKFLEVATAVRLVKEVARLGWNPRWEIAGRGEPTMNPHLVEIIGTIRNHLQDATIILTTNGSGLFQRPSRIQDLFDAGLNTMALDDYKHAAFVPKIRTYLEAGIYDFKVYEYPRDKEANPYKRTDEKRFVILQDLVETAGHNNVRNVITNQGGASGTKKVNVKEPCSKPFRDLTIRWDGRMALCCDDWPGHFKVGSVLDTPLDELWRSPPMEAARRRLLRGQRTFKPCAGCDVRTKRNGLLPDKMGKDKAVMSMPDAESDAVLRTATAGPVQTPKI